MLRKDYFSKIKRAFEIHPVVALLGPRQVGKTTLARQYIEALPKPFPYTTHYFDLEDPAHLDRLQNPQLALQDLSGLVVIDEVQRIPDLFALLRVLVDRPQAKTKFLILGSASRDLLRQGSETLAGRIRYLEVYPFSLQEVGYKNYPKLWLRGGLPPSYLAPKESLSLDWRESYIRTFLERDIPQLGIQVPAANLRRFWMMLAHYHGQIFNSSELARSLSTSDTTVRRYLDILTGTLMIRALPPWFENIAKRQVKRPKIYFKDSGLFHKLLGIADQAALKTHPKLGASWEGFALEEIIRHPQAMEEEVYFWAVHGQAELDLLMIKNGKRLGFEIKYSDSPKISKTHYQLCRDLKLDRLYFLTPLDSHYWIEKNMVVLSLNHLSDISWN